LVLEVGVHALTLRALAADLGLGVNTVRRLVDPSTELAVLAADEVRTRRRRDRWARLPEDKEAAVRVLMRRLLPDDDSRIDEELVWLRLTASFEAVPIDLEARGRVRHDFQVAEGGWSDPNPDPDPDMDADMDADMDPETVSIPDTHGDAQTQPRNAMSRYFAERRSEVDAIIGRVVDLLEVADREFEKARLRALVDGLTLAVCLGRISPEECVRSMDRHLAGLWQPPARVAG
jgi:hypothetical protein